LAQVMERLADYIEERNNLRGKILTAFIYPGVVGLVSIGIVIFLLSYVVPQVVSAFFPGASGFAGINSGDAQRQ
jgi:general secretion pathway protein F